MTEGVIIAENVAAEPAPEPASFAEYQNTWTPEERKDWDDNGKEPAPKPAIPVVSDKTPAPAKANITPAAGTGEEDQDHEPEYFGTTEQQAKQRHAFAKVKRERAEFKAKYELLERQRAEKPAVAAAAPSRAATSTPATERPKRPRINDAKYSVTGGGDLYDTDMDAYESSVKAFDRSESQRERSEQLAAEERRNVGRLWADELSAARIEDPNFDSIVFSDSFIVSLPMAGVFMGMKGGARAMKYLATHPEEAAELVEATDIPGAFKNYDELVIAADSDPRLARQLGIAEGVVRAAAKRILASPNGNGKAPDPKPVIVTKVGPVAARVDSSGSPAKDALSQAMADYEKTGDHKYLVLINKLEDERDAAAARRR